MGRYDDISDSKLRYEVQRFARILQRMEEKDEVLDRTADILTLLGELRRMVFAWEVRATFQGDEAGDPGTPDPSMEAASASGSEDESDSERIVREALEQHSDFIETLDDVRDASGPPADEGPSEGDAESDDEDDG